MTRANRHTVFGSQANGQNLIAIFPDPGAFAVDCFREEDMELGKWLKLSQLASAGLAIALAAVLVIFSYLFWQLSRRGILS